MRSHLTVGRLDMRVDDINDTRGRELFDRVLAAASRVPGVERAAIVDELPGENAARPVQRRGLLTSGRAVAGFRTGDRRAAEADIVRATPGVVDTLGLRLLRGRSLMPSDVDGAPLVAVLTEKRAADALWPGTDAVGPNRDWEVIPCATSWWSALRKTRSAAGTASGSDKKRRVQHAAFERGDGAVRS